MVVIEFYIKVNGEEYLGKFVNGVTEISGRIPNGENEAWVRTQMRYLANRFNLARIEHVETGDVVAVMSVELS